MKKIAQYIDVIALFMAVIGAIWLLFFGAWQIVVIGAIYGFFGMYLISIFLMPQLILSVPAHKSMRKKKSYAAVPLLIVRSIYVFGLFTLSAFLIMTIEDSVIKNDHSLLIPLLIWSFAVIMLPWLRLNSKAQGEEIIATRRGIVLFSLILAVIMTCIYLFHIQTALWVFLMTAIIAAIVDSVAEYSQVYS